MAYTIAFDNTYPPGNTAANLISGTFRDKTTMIGERLVDIFGMPDFTSDPLRISSVRVGYGVAGFGGYVKFTDDTGTYRWFSGIGSGAGNKNYVIFDTVNSVSRLSIDAVTGVITSSNGIVILAGNVQTAGNVIAAGTMQTGANLIVATGLAVTTGGIHVSAGNVQLDQTLQVAGIITASGGITGNVTGNCSGSSGSCTGNAATATNVNATGIVGNIVDGQIVSLTANKLTGALPAISGAALTNLTGANVTGTVANATTSANCSGNAATATLASNSTNLGGVAAASYALLSGATFTGNISVPHANSMSAGSFFVI